MVSRELADDVLQEMERMPLDLQQRVFEFAHALADSHPKGASGEDIVRFRGTFSQSDLKDMSEAIEKGCERVDPDAW